MFEADNGKKSSLNTFSRKVKFASKYPNFDVFAIQVNYWNFEC